MQKSNAIHLIFAATFAVSVASAASSEPFWRAKPKVFKKVTEDRQIVVSVDAEKLPDNLPTKSILHMEGGGLVDTDAAATFAEAQNYDELKKVSDHVLEVRVGPAPQDLFLHTAAFDYHARMTMRVTAETSADGVRHLRFMVLEGNFKGMTGDFSFAEYVPEAASLSKRGTLMGFHADYGYSVLPMPQFFVEFGLEVVLQRVASRMRTFLEEKLKAKAMTPATKKQPTI